MNSVFLAHLFPFKNDNFNYLRALLHFIFGFTAFAATSGLYAQNLGLQLRAGDTHNDSIVASFDFKKSFIDFSSLKNELNHVADTLYRYGYIDYRLTNLSKPSDTLYVGDLILGKRLKKLRIHTNDPLILAYAKKLRLPTNGDSFSIDPEATEKTLSRFAAMEAEAGYPLTYFRLQNLRRKEGYLKADLIYNRELRRTIDDIVVKGYAKYPKSFVKYYASLKTGRPYDQEQIIKRSQDLAKLPFLTSIRQPEVLFARDSTSVFLYLEKTQANRFEGFLGFGTDESTGKIKLDGNLNLTLINNLNFGESLEINYKSDGDDQQNLHLAADLPFLGGSPVGVKLKLNLFRQDSTFSTNSQEAQLSYILGTRSQVRAGAFFESSSNLLNNRGTAPPELSDYKKTLFGVGYGLNPKTENRLMGISSEANLYTSYGNRQAGSTKENQLSAELDAAYTFHLTGRQQLYLSNTTKSLSSGTYFTNELFRFGGNKSIRGFQENFLLANLYTTFRTEYRYVPANNLYLHTIFDAAYFENDVLNTEGYLYSFGVGAAVLTKGGVLNFNIANGLQEGQMFKFSDSIIHLEFRAFF